jgi:hypothetical protein
MQTHTLQRKAYVTAGSVPVWVPVRPADAFLDVTVRQLAYLTRLGAARVVHTLDAPRPAAKPPARVKPPKPRACPDRPADPTTHNPGRKHATESRTLFYPFGFHSESAVRLPVRVVYVASNARSRRSIARAFGNAPDPTRPACGPDCEQLGSFVRDCLANRVAVSVCQLDAGNGQTAFQVAGLPSNLDKVCTGLHWTHATDATPPRYQQPSQFAGRPRD